MPPRVKRASSTQRAADAVEASPQNSFEPLEIVVSRLIAEMTEHRIRQRALLDVLRQDGFPWENYLEALRSVRTRDHAALFGSIVLARDAFQAEFSAWAEADAARFQFEVVPALPKSAPTKRVPSSGKGKKVAPPSKRREP